ncbi:MAG TPA: hypothetical protein VHH73_17215 [Verrucomicrobiae bacterium]|nr:hypothetical protein [Verrucomicrobiae bacterium]
MGLLDFFSRQPGLNLLRLPSGSFTILPDGRISSSTLPQSFPAQYTREIGRLVLSTFKAARLVNQPLSELIVEYSSLKITAREMRGGAIIFLAPRDLTQK